MPLYVQDFLTDEKLAECSASANGVYIRLMCLLHKSEEYGKISLKDKDICRGKLSGKTSGKYSGKASLFACKLARHLPYSTEEIEEGLEELLDEGVLSLDGNTLYQKRMVRDAEISEKRSISGRRGAYATNNNNTRSASNGGEFAEKFAEAKGPVNTETENETENEYENKDDIREREIVKGETVQVEVVEDPEFEDFVSWIRDHAPRVAKMKEPFTRDQYYAITDKYYLDDVKMTLEQMHNYKSLKTISAYLTCQNWLRRDNARTKISGVSGTIQAPAKGSKVFDTLGAISEALR